MQKVFRVTVDISKKIPAPAFEVNTNDLKSVKLEITITNGQSLLDLTGVTPRINIRKPDNEVIFQDCEIVDAKAGKVQIVLENQAYLVPGTHTAEIACYKGSEITAITGTFSYKSIKGIMNDEAVESKSEFTAIDRKLIDVQEILEDVRENGTGIDAQARKDLQNVTTQLADTGQYINKVEDRANNQVMQKSTRKVIASFVDDDGSADVYTKLRPLVLDMKFKVTSALVTDNINKTGALSEAQVKELYNTGLFEFVSHTKTHKYLANETEPVQMEELRASKEWLRSRGYTHDIIVYPYGSTNATVRKNTRKFYRAGVFIDNGQHKVNYPPLQTFNIERIYVDFGLDIAKQKIDEAIANKGWLVFGMHCWYENWDANVVRGIVNYLREKNVDIVSMEEGLNQYSNVIEIGDSSNLNEFNTQIVDADGFSHGMNVPQTVLRLYNENTFKVTNDSPPSFFPIGKTTITNIGYGIGRANGFPRDVGILRTHIYTGLNNFPYTFQEFLEANSDTVLTRYWNRNTSAWSAWQDKSMKYFVTDGSAYSSNTKINEFPIGTSITPVSTNNATGFPDNTAGLLITYRALDSWGRQEYKVYQKGLVYERFVASGGVWSAWSQTNSQFKIGGIHTNDEPITAYPLNEVTVNQIPTNSATGFPENKAGLLTTYRTADAFGRQEYRLYQSNSIYGRYINSSGAWSAWEKITAV